MIGVSMVNREGRAAWVWRVDDPDALVTFAAARRLDELFVHVPVRVDTHPELPNLGRLARAAHARGIRVAALGGDPGWLDDPAAVVTEWLAPALGTGLFDGVHLDVEPHLTAPSASRPMVDRFVAVVRGVAESVPIGIPLEADVRFWYPDVPAGGRDLMSTLAPIVDAVTVLSYRNRTSGRDGSVALTSPTARIVAAAGRRFRVGQETVDLGPDPAERKQTFYGRPREELETAMGIIDNAFGAMLGYVGTAVHDWRGYQRLPSTPTNDERPRIG